MIILIFFFALIGMEQFMGVFDYCNESGAGQLHPETKEQETAFSLQIV